MSLLKIEGLTVGYYVSGEKRIALKDINLEIKRGEIFGVAGESGSGKTTLGLSILRLLANNGFIESGKVIFNGVDLLTKKNKKMREIRGGKIGLIFQDPLNALNPVYTAGYQVKEAIKMHQEVSSKKELNKKVIEIFKTVRLKNPKDIAESYPHQLSGGMRQRVVIAQAISSNPALLIADEPTSNLDVTIQKEILDLFKELRESLDLTILLISHDLDLIRYICDKVGILNEGRIEEVGDSRKTFLHPETKYTKKLVQSSKFFTK